MCVGSRGGGGREGVIRGAGHRGQEKDEWLATTQPTRVPPLKLTSANGVNPKKPSSVGNPMLSLNCEHEEDGARKVRGALSVSMVN